MSTDKPRIRVEAGDVTGATARDMFYTHGRSDYEPDILAGFLPNLREPADEVDQNLYKQVSRILSLQQSSGFFRNVVEISVSQVVGCGLRMSSRPNADRLGWSDKEAEKFSTEFETAFRTWAQNPYSCDASGQFTFGGLQQAYLASAASYGEGLSLIVNEKRPGVKNTTKVKLLPPSRIVDRSDGIDLVQGVRTNKWGLPISYLITEKFSDGTIGEREIRVRDRDGRQTLVHRFMPNIAVTRGMPTLGAGMKSYRQFDQYGDANLTQKMVRSIFGAIIHSQVNGMEAFRGLMTQQENVAADASGASNFDWQGYVQQHQKFYKNSKLDLTQHGRIGQLFPGDKMEFVESKAANDEFDPIARWLMLEFAASAGLSYESATGDYRGATYSSIRMAGAKEWQGVLRKRNELVAPFNSAVATAFLEEEIFTGRIKLPGGKDFKFFLDNREDIARTTWNGPAQPQADEFKAARAAQVRIDSGIASVQEVSDEYGTNYDETVVQQGRENEAAKREGVPPPHGRADGFFDEPEGEDLNAPATADKGDRKKPKKTSRNRRGGGRDVPDREPKDALDTELEVGLLKDE
ncbi:phage portal protein [Maritalea porphyrae]|uniref:phage portal protein n=1 Tax=Maritalea porphyrae TaxID=880732 RepID=UPI0022B05007|nr:phage portal protein [Maritalea porphyrae]MCZ4270727.1 phage portal protein [Maritalea porphyrae]